MIKVDIPMPRNCDDCPFSYLIRSGIYEGHTMCNAMEARTNAMVFREPSVTYDPFVPHDDDYLIDDYLRTKPDNCPIIEEVEEKDDNFSYRR